MLRLHLHRLQEPSQIELLLIRPLVPQLSQIIEPAFLALLLDFTSRHVHHVFFSTYSVLIVKRSGGRGLAEVEEIEDLIGFHGCETGVLLVHHGGGDIDFEALETSNFESVKDLENVDVGADDGKRNIL